MFMNEYIINFKFLYQASHFSRNEKREKKTKMRKKVPVSISLSQHSKFVFTPVGLQQQKICEPVNSSEYLQKKFKNYQIIKVGKLS